MKVVFLDIDGVLNCKSTPNPRGFPYIVDSELLSPEPPELMPRPYCYPPGATTLRACGARGTTAFLSATSSRTCLRTRVAMKYASGKTHPEVTRYVVIDDEDDELDDLPVFQPSATTGLTVEIAKAAAAYLNGETEECLRRSWFVHSAQNLMSRFRRKES